MKRTYIILLSGLNLLLVASFLITFDKSLLVYAQKLDTNDTDILITVPTKANVTEGAATTKANVTEGAATTKANVTEGAATKASLLKTNDKKNVKFCYNSQFGSLGTGDGQFNRPHDIVFDSKGFLYINDRELNNFQKFSHNGKFIAKFGEEGEELGQFKSPYSMAIASNDNIYVLDRGNDRIQKVSTDGTPLGALYSYDGVFITSNDDISKAVNKDKKPSEEEKLKQFASPEAMAIDKEGNFYVTDTGHNRIIKFDKNFKYISHFGQRGQDQVNLIIHTE